MMPSIEAAEILNASTSVALGGGNMKKADAQRLRRKLMHRADRGGRKAPKANVEVLKMMGIVVEVRDG